MLVQSVSSFVLQRYEDLIEDNVIIASYLTMLVGGGGNAAVQVVTDIVRRQTQAQHDVSGKYEPPKFARTIGREALLALMAAVTVAGVAYPRVRYLSFGSLPSALDAVAISTAYCVIIVLACTVAVIVTFFLHWVDKKGSLASAGAPPSVQVLVDVLGILVAFLIFEALLGKSFEDPPPDPPPPS